MAYVCDIVLLLFIFVSAILGAKRGLVKTAFKCLSLACAIALAYFFGSYAGDYLKTTPVYENLSEKTAHSISERFDKVQESGIEQMISAQQNFDESEIGKTLARLGFETDSLFEKYKEELNDGAEKAKNEFALEASQKIMSCIANALGILITFVISLVLLKILSLVLDKLFSLPILKTFNKAGGLLLGIVFGILLCFVTCMILQIIMPCIPENPILYPGMEKDTVIFAFFTDINPFILLLFG